MIYSFSRLQKFVDCPWSFYKHYVLEQKEPPTEPLAFGSAVHAAIQAVVQKGVSREEALLDAMEEAPCKIDVREARLQVDRAIGMVMQRLNGQEVLVEEHFRLPLDPADPFAPELQGYIDAFCRDEYRILDWKTGRRVYSHDENKQLGLYAWAVAQEYGLNQVYASLVFLRTNQESGGWYGPAEMEEARKWAHSLAAEIEVRLMALSAGGAPEKIFPPSPGSKACAYCALADAVCGQKLVVAPEAIVADVPAVPGCLSEAEDLAREILRLDAALGAMKDALKAWVRANGPVAVNGQEWALRQSVSWEFSPEQLKALAHALVDEGKNPWQYLTIGSTQIKKLGWEESKLRQYGTPKIAETFRCAKEKEERKKDKVA